MTDKYNHASGEVVDDMAEHDNGLHLGIEHLEVSKYKAKYAYKSPYRSKAPDGEEMDISDEGVETDELDSESDGNTMDDLDEDSPDFNTEAESQHGDADEGMKGANFDTRAPEVGPTSSSSSSGESGPAFIKATQLSFSELQRRRHLILRGSSKYASLYAPCQLAESSVHDSDLKAKVKELMGKIRELEDTKKNIELQIEAYERDIEAARQHKIDQQVKVLLEHNGISEELIAEYDAFRDAIEPQCGQRGGFSITCFGDHQGSYVNYDPSLELFKQNVEDDYTACHYRCEASKVDGPWVVGESGMPGPTREYIVEFWPVGAPILRGSTSFTWGGQFPKLYQLAMGAAWAGSQAALDMLVALPDKDSSSQGGWLFDYEFEPTLKNHSFIAKRWRFRGSYNINKPISADEKRRSFKEMLRI
ncbi:hypothetical protein EG329_009620 [Mollisiaceae sp. DMI_Dod_QoI]|nr:hypothetical protein EG329_009620 [Helotiales sp. DMI_Dod_QoI]